MKYKNWQGASRLNTNLVCTAILNIFYNAYTLIRVPLAVVSVQLKHDSQVFPSNSLFKYKLDFMSERIKENPFQESNEENVKKIVYSI